MRTKVLRDHVSVLVGGLTRLAVTLGGSQKVRTPWSESGLLGLGATTATAGRASIVKRQPVTTQLRILFAVISFSS